MSPHTLARPQSEAAGESLATLAGQRAVVSWLAETRASLAGSSWDDLLTYHGHDVADLIVGALYQELVHALRAVASTPSIGRAVVERMRTSGYRLKNRWRELVARRDSVPPRRADVAFWPRHYTHNDVQQPVAAALEKAGAATCFFVSDHGTLTDLKRRGVAATLGSAAWPETLLRARHEGRQRARRLVDSAKPQLPPLPFASSQLVPQAAVWQTLAGHLPDALVAVANAEQLLARAQPRVLVAGNDLLPEGRALCRVAAAQGIPVAVLAHGTLTYEALHGMHCGRPMLVFGQSHRRTLLALGMPAEAILVVGPPHLDALPRQTGQLHPQLQRMLHLAADAPYVLVATSGPGHKISHDHHRLVIEHVMRLSAALPQATFVAKLHPKDHPRYYRQVAPRVPGQRLHVVRRTARGFPASIFDWLQGCSLVLTGASTVAIEAMLVGVPVVTMDFCREVSDVDFIDAGATRHVEDYDALLAAVGQRLASPPLPPDLQQRTDEYLADAFLALDGQAATRAADALLRLMDRPQRAAP